jgi:DNA-binding NtrC family response regulator/pSer/pThr/pTyr-binding forkhead associated (FHA) protein
MSQRTTGDDISATATSALTPDASPDPSSIRTYLLVFERGGSWVFELPRDGEIIIGRGDLAELRLNDNAVSRRHAVLQLRDGAVTLRDLGSHNGTFVNGVRLAAPQLLRSGDSLTVCATTLVLYSTAPVPSGMRRLVDYGELRRRFEAELERALRYQRPFTVLVGRLASEQDHGKVNDGLSTLRGLDLAAWLDPTQLVILAPEAGRDDADQMARRLGEQFAKLDLKLGYAVCPDDGCDADALLMGARAAAAAAANHAVAAVATARRTYRIGNRNVIVADPAMARLYALVERLARVDLPVLITGETGSGKELAATMVHERSLRHAGPLVALNCAAIQENLVESELFGHERGAFSGALTTKLGLLEAAGKGTIFLDEIGELPLAIQAKLLRVLETKRLTRVGDVRERESDFRLVAATNRNLQHEVDAGRFRQDLFFRLSGATLSVPPLRERLRELALLAELFLSDACRLAGRSMLTLGPEALALMEGYRWPGNVRELKNVMEYVAATTVGDRIAEADLAERLNAGATPTRSGTIRIPTLGSDPAVVPPTEFVPIGDEIRALEIQRMTQALDAAGGNQTRAAELIGMPLRTFFTKVRQYGLKR